MRSSLIPYYAGSVNMPPAPPLAFTRFPDGSNTLVNISSAVFVFPPSRIYTSQFQHLYLGSSNRTLEYPEWLNAQTFYHTIPIPISFQRWRPVSAWSDRIHMEWSASECPTLDSTGYFIFRFLL
ncbi:hypothetical protein AVEN_59070-1 [Araneus ventricosus]|uniref:Uncharacterized protein n=1 Tax=Araneus ventricosus TaxID=182803 RepID=A0A4Y2SF21_ARAVE|nr:hypothetical protein AVEN_59070-1 [Araneus ventricosus]